jgi:hypothetical protein
VPVPAGVDRHAQVLIPFYKHPVVAYQLLKEAIERIFKGLPARFQAATPSFPDNLGESEVLLIRHRCESFLKPDEVAS